MFSNLYLEKAYCEYRLNHFIDALKTVSSCPEDTPGIMELKGQIVSYVCLFVHFLSIIVSKSLKTPLMNMRN